MEKKEDFKKIERRARSMLLSKDIPAHKQELVRTLINNSRLNPDEKWRAVIELVQNCPDKKVVFYEERAPLRRGKKKPPGQKDVPLPSPESSAPTETSYYIDKIYRKYRRLKLFRIRLVVHRDNRIGIGFRRRLIPSKKLLKAMDLVAQAQHLILSRVDAIMMEILNDPAIEDPGVFNYLRLVRKWMVDVPLSGEQYNSIKWMERHDFDRLYRGFVGNFYSFLKLDGSTREKILTEAEARLRSLISTKNEMESAGLDNSFLQNEKLNLEKEHQVYEYMMTLRSFLPADPEFECLLSRQLQTYYSVTNLSELMRMIEEALVFQRPIRTEEIVAYYRIEAPIVAMSAWDCSDELLKRAGKDPETIRRKMREFLQKQLEPYETRAMLLKQEIDGQNLLLKAYADQMRYFSRKQQDPKAAYNDNFINFIHGLVSYFKNLYVPFLDGSVIVFRDMGREEHEGTLFSVAYFAGLLDEFKGIVEGINSYRNENPGMEYARDEVKKAMKGGPESSFKAGALFQEAGECFYKIGKELQLWYDSHRRWASSHARFANTELIRVSIKESDLSDHDEEDRPIPFYDCVVKEVADGSALVNELIGKRVLEDSLRDGVYVRMNAFAYQAAYECLNERLFQDIEEMKSLRKRMEQG